MNGDGGFDFSCVRFVPRDFYDTMAEGRIRINDILIVKDGATTGKVSFVGEEFPHREAAINEHVFLCRPISGLVIPRYLFLWLRSTDGQRAILANYRGAAIGGINRRFTDAIEVPLPPLPEQKRIASLLNEQMAAKVQVKAAKALPAAYLREVFESEEARGWPRRRLGEVSDLLPARTIASDGDAEVIAVTTACLSELGFQPSGVKRARMWSKTVRESTLSAGEVLIARSNTPELVGRVSMFEGQPEGAVASDLTIRIMPHEPLQSSFLAAYLSSLYMTGYWKTRAGGASGSMKKITRRQIEGQQVPVPSPTEQERVAAPLRLRLVGAKRLKDQLEAQRQDIERLPSSLLLRAFRGEL
jgi:type I restriction enzyme S subunit